MDPNQQGQAPGGRRLHIGHRRNPSDLTPLMAEQLALQHQIEMLQAQQQQMLNAHQQYVALGMMQQGQPHLGQPAFNQLQPQVTQQLQSQHGFQFPQPQNVPLGAPTQPSALNHRRQGSTMGGPPPAPSSGTAGSGDGSSGPQRRPSGGQTAGAPGHNRRHSLAVADAIKAAESAQARRGPAPAGFQFPYTNPTGPSGGGTNASNAAAGSATGSTTAASDASSTASIAPSTTSQPSSGPPRAGMRGHGRSQSMAVGGSNTRGAGGSGRLGGFQFPPPANNDTGSSSQQQQTGGQNVERRSSGHQRSGSRNYEGNWRNQNQNQNAAPTDSTSQNQPQAQQFNQGFQPGHRSRASMNASIGSFSFPAQPGILIPGAPSQGIYVNPATGQPQLLNPNLLTQQQQLTQLQLQQAAQALTAQQMGLGQLGVSQAGAQQMNNQQQRKTLFTPYLPQASLPALLSNGQLVSGILRVNKKNRSDAYVSTQDDLLDADIFICGSKDRNRALEGDLVAVELLDVDEVWGQKREKEEKKKRKDNTTITSSTGASSTGNAEGTEQGTQEGGGMRRRGSLRQRPTQKKNDDVEVEGQSLLLVEEEEINDEQKPLYAGHIVAVIERVAGQMFSGTLGLLRPSSQATKEKQEAERQAREGSSSRNPVERLQEKPKIVWFKPTDKRVPLIAIPTEQAPRDFVENHQAYANRIFVACIKRWPITSLHPFGTLVEQLGEMGDTKIETDALLRDNNFGPDEFADAVVKSVGLENWSLETEDESVVSSRTDLRSERIFTIIPDGQNSVDSALHIKDLNQTTVEIGFHVSDIAHFVKVNSLVDREAKKRGTGVNLINRTVPLLPARLADELLAIKKDEDRLCISVIFHVRKETGEVLDEETQIVKSIVKAQQEITHSVVNEIIAGEETQTDEELANAVRMLFTITQKLRAQRLQLSGTNNDILRLLQQLDDEAVPVEENIFSTTSAQNIVEELAIKTNAAVAAKLFSALPEKALLRRHAPAIQRRIEIFRDRMERLGFKIDTKNGGTLQNGLLNLESEIVRKGMQTLLIKSMQRGKYYVAGKLPESMRPHYINNLPLYTHFTNPTRRYADIIVHRQLESILSNGSVEFAEDIESLTKIAEQCNVKKDSAKNAQEQSIHLQLCRKVDQRRSSVGELICEAIVINVYESAFDVLIPEYGFEKRVHCDQLPLKKAEFDKTNRVLELYWEKGVQSNAYIPEDERPKGVAALRAANAQAAATAAAAAAKAAQEKEEEQRKIVDISSLSIDEVDALFDGEDELTESGMPPSPSGKTTSQIPHRTRSDPKLTVTSSDTTISAEATLKEKYGRMFTLREEKGDYIQEVREMTMVPVFLKTELSKSPPCLTIRSLNPYAL